MLSLGSNISSTQSVEAKYSAVFDGEHDFIDCGPSTSVIANGASDVSVMFWIKTTTSESNRYIFSIKRGFSSSAFSCIISSNKASSIIHTGSGSHTNPASTTSINDGTWHHVAITANASSQKIYVDGGTAEDTHTDGFDMDTTADTFMIGDHDTSKFMEMTLSSLAVFNTELSQENIQAAYDGGGDFNLTFNQGNYNSSSNLTAYYKMGNGLFDDKAIGIVHDQDNPGFGSNLVTNGHFDVNTSGWSGSGGSYIHSLTWEKDCLYFCSVDLYLVSGKFRMDGADTAVIGAGTGSNNNIIGIETYDAAIDDRWRTLTGYAVGVASGDTDELWIRSFGTSSSQSITQGTFGGRSGVARFVFADTGEFYIDNVSVKKLNGNPGITSSTEGEIIFSSDTP
tara:strand:- start:644 stop:1831 length:1188 start_codon:yes stop_codon:yes gene_type:complete